MMMMSSMRSLALLLWSIAFVSTVVTAFAPACSIRSNSRSSYSATTTSTTFLSEGSNNSDRRDFIMNTAVTTAMASAISLLSVSVSSPLPAQAKVFLDPAMYGDQELRVSAVDTLRERVRRAILQNPALAPAFYQLSLLDGLTYDAKSGQYGPNGGIVYLVLSLKSPSTPYLQRLQEAAQVVVESSKALKKVSSITIADSLALSGAQAIESIGGPVLPVQLGRMDIPNAAAGLASINLELLSGKLPPSQVEDAFRRAGLTEREMTALLGALMTIELVEKERTTGDWKASAKPKFRERGKMGRMDEYKRLTDEDFANAERTEFDDDDDDEEGSLLGAHDDGWYIADSFGSREERFGDRIGKGDIDEKSFNKYLKSLTDSGKTRTAAADTEADYGWVAMLLLDPESPVTQSWLSKYGASNLSFLKDLKIAFNSVTQLGAEYTGGKYESLLKDKPRKSLSDL